MNLPIEYVEKKEWMIIGPMGPKLPSQFNHLPILAVDGGADFTSQMDIWVGDGDSIKNAVKTHHKFEFNPQKDLSDLALALQFFQSQGFVLHLWGFDGGRKDHFLFNLGECLQYLEKNHQSKIFFYNEDPKPSPSFIFFPKGESTFSHKGTFSLGSIYSVKLQMTGHCEYKSESTKTILPLSSFGLSNKAFGEVKIKCSHPIFIHLLGDDS
jgi:thiamine pyrophosphokinase